MYNVSAGPTVPMYTMEGLPGLRGATMATDIRVGAGRPNTTLLI